MGKFGAGSGLVALTLAFAAAQSAGGTSASLNATAAFTFPTGIHTTANMDFGDIEALGPMTSSTDGVVLHTDGSVTSNSPGLLNPISGSHAGRVVVQGEAANGGFTLSCESGLLGRSGSGRWITVDTLLVAQVDATPEGPCDATPRTLDADGRATLLLGGTLQDFAGFGRLTPRGPYSTTAGTPVQVTVNFV